MAIARAVALSPALIICDEAVSSLDVLIQAQVLNLFERLRAELGLSYLFIAHDLALVKQVSDRVAVMYLGKLCEVGPGEAVYRRPLHPYTLALLESVPGPDQAPRRRPRPSAGSRRRRSTRRADAGSAPGARGAQQRCADEEPGMRQLATGHIVACHFPLVAGGTHPGPSEEKIGETAMRLRVLLEPHFGASYAQILAMARATEESGFDAFFRSDHYLGIDSTTPPTALPTRGPRWPGWRCRPSGSGSAR